MSELEICTTCFDLRGPFRGWVNPCDCDLAVLRARGERHPRFGDLVISAQLCQCCTLEVLASGSRFSPWFCDDCRPRIVERNRAVGICVVPIGRHSIMNGVALSGTDAGDADQVTAFVARLGSIFERMKQLDVWARQRTGRHLEALGLLGPAAVSVATYFDVARSRGLGKDAAVDDLWQAFV